MGTRPNRSRRRPRHPTQLRPHLPGYTLAIRSTTCYEVEGDYVDVVLLPDDRLIFALVDVAGKGLASALISMTFHFSFRATSLGQQLRQRHRKPRQQRRLQTLRPVSI